MTTSTVRRHLPLRATAMAILLCVGAFGSRAGAATQDNWRTCGKCRVMFYNGFPNKGRCPLGPRDHSADGKDFILSYNVPETGTAQAGWRLCTRCNALFFDRDAQKGACPTGGGHTAHGHVFVLPHDVPPRGSVQQQWRRCDKCDAMFYNATRDKGRCAAGGAHRAQGHNFVLRYRGSFERD